MDAASVRRRRCRLHRLRHDRLYRLHHGRRHRLCRGRLHSLRRTDDDRSEANYMHEATAMISPLVNLFLGSGHLSMSVCRYPWSHHFSLFSLCLSVCLYVSLCLSPTSILCTCFYVLLSFVLPLSLYLSVLSCIDPFPSSNTVPVHILFLSPSLYISQHVGWCKTFMGQRSQCIIFSALEGRKQIMN